MSKFSQCNVCEKPIVYDEKFSSIVYNKECATKKEKKIYVTINHSESIITLCEVCEKKIDNVKLKSTIKLFCKQQVVRFDEDEFMDFGSMDNPEYTKMLSFDDEIASEEERDAMIQKWHDDEDKKYKKPL